MDVTLTAKLRHFGIRLLRRYCGELGGEGRRGVAEVAPVPDHRPQSPQQEGRVVCEEPDDLGASVPEFVDAHVGSLRVEQDLRLSFWSFLESLLWFTFSFGFHSGFNCDFVTSDFPRFEFDFFTWFKFMKHL